MVKAAPAGALENLKESLKLTATSAQLIKDGSGGDDDDDGDDDGYEGDGNDGNDEEEDEEEEEAEIDPETEGEPDPAATGGGPPDDPGPGDFVLPKGKKKKSNKIPSAPTTQCTSTESQR